MDPSHANQERPISKSSHSNFSPFVAKTIQFPGRADGGPSIYIEQYDMIISCHAKNPIKFYNATTLLSFRTLQLPSPVVQIAHLPDSEICLFACSNGDMYSYNFSSNIVKRVLKKTNSFSVLAIEFLNSGEYFLLASDSIVHANPPPSLYLAKLYENSSKRLLQYKTPSSIHFLSKSKILLIGLSNGSIVSARDLSVLDSTQPIPGGRSFREKHNTAAITSAIISGKEYIITGGLDNRMRIWHFVKGKMRLLRVIKTEDIISRIIYLEKYQMIVTTCRKNYVKFWRFCSGKLELKLVLGNQQYEGVFFMKDKNMLGVTCSLNNEIKFVQLHGNGQ